nr:integrase, catalytic region, zinc finger, CCHC-type, peptidase aspartic, catalytic [Tanacetum cinerariifolium]
MPRQNSVIKRRNRTLVEATRTMLIFSKALEFLWDEAITNAFFTQTCSIIHTRHNKTPYELIQGRKPNIQYFYMFGSFCYATNDCDDLRKMKPKANIDSQSVPSKYVTSSQEVSNNFAANTLDNEHTSSSSSIVVEEDEAPQIVSSSAEKVTAEPNTPVLNENTNELVQEDVADFDEIYHTGCNDDCKSTSGGIQFLEDKLVSWSSKKQDCTTMSNAKADIPHGSTGNSSCSNYFKISYNWEMQQLRGVAEYSMLSPECKIIGQILLDHPLSYALTATVDVPVVYLQQFWRTVSKVPVETPENLFVTPVNIETIEAFMNKVGYQGVVDKDDIPLVSVYTIRDVRVRGMLIPDAFLAEEICATDDIKETPTLTASPQGKTRNQSVRESRSPRKTHKITIKKRKQITPSIPPSVDDREKDVIDEVTLLSLSLHKTALAAEAQENVSKVQEKLDEEEIEKTIESESHKKHPKHVTDDDEEIKKKKKDEEVEKEKEDVEIEKEKDIVDNETSSTKIWKERKQTPIPSPIRSPRNVSSSKKTVFEELTTTISPTTATISKDSSTTKRNKRSFSHKIKTLPGKIREVLDHCNKIVPEMTFVKTNEMIKEEMPRFVKLVVDKDREVSPVDISDIDSKESAGHGPTMIEKLGNQLKDDDNVEKIDDVGDEKDNDDHIDHTLVRTHTTGSMETKNEQMHTPIPTPNISPRKDLSSNKIISEISTANVSPTTATTSKSKSKKGFTSNKTKILPGSIDGMYLILKEFSTHAPKIIEELFKKHMQNTTLNLYPTPSSSTAEISTTDLQHQLYLKLKSNPEDQAADLELWEILKVKMEDPNITMEEYIKLEEEKARRNDQVYNCETATLARSRIMKTFMT